MKLTDVKLRGLGRFEESPAAFTLSRFNLPARWDYVYTNGRALLRVKHDGGAYLQSDPPGGPAMIRQERGETAPALLTWIIPDGGTSRGLRAFTNFWLPTVPSGLPGAEPDAFACTFAPDAARWTLRFDRWRVDTELWMTPDLPAIVMTVRVTNDARRTRGVTLMPAMRPHMAPFSLAPWDVPHYYQTCALARAGKALGTWIETRDPGGRAERRFRGALVTDLDACCFEVAADDFLGRGEWANPQAVWDATLARPVSRRAAYPYGRTGTDVAAAGRPIVAAFAHKTRLAPGAHREFTLVFGKLPETPDGSLPRKSELAKLARYLSPDARRKGLAAVRRRYDALFAMRRIATPDAAFDRYVNEWLPLQLDWVIRLDRGWPVEMRGTRDAAQDATAMVPLDPALARARLIEIFSAQRSDGWFLRQYSTLGPEGAHDHRAYVDTGCWVWELLWEYVCAARDFGLLNERVRWLDAKATSTLADHAERLFGYYLSPRNIGEHGLAKIRNGDWNDSVNAAGLEGRGETVMVTCQVVLGLEQAADLFDLLAAKGDRRGARVAAKFRRGARRFRKAVLRHALNREGYFNQVFNDAGKWIFTPKDPDGRRRVNGPANSFAVISGIAQGKVRESVFRALDSLKGPNGWRLFWPPIGVPPIDKLGRIGQGDKLPGLGENGTVYNHGAQGFLGRACWTAGRGTMLHRVLVSMFPYDQKCHPVEVQKTPPYGVVNHWREAPGLEGTGGDAFLSGSISTAVRNVYQGLVGLRPGLTRLVIDPCIPASWRRMKATVPFLGGRWTIRVSNPAGVESGVRKMLIDGTRAGRTMVDGRLGRKVIVLDVATLAPGGDHDVEILLGT